MQHSRRGAALTFLYAYYLKELTISQVKERFLMDNEKLFSTKEAADFLNVSIVTLKRWRKSGKLKPITTRINGYSEYSFEQLVSFKTSITQHQEEYKPVSHDTSLGKDDTGFEKNDTTFNSKPVSQTSITEKNDTGCDTSLLKISQTRIF